MIMTAEWVEDGGANLPRDGRSAIVDSHTDGALSLFDRDCDRTIPVLDGVRDQIPERLSDAIGIALREQIPSCPQRDGPAGIRLTDLFDYRGHYLLKVGQTRLNRKRRRRRRAGELQDVVDKITHALRGVMNADSHRFRPRGQTPGLYQPA